MKWEKMSKNKNYKTFKYGTLLFFFFYWTLAEGHLLYAFHLICFWLQSDYNHIELIIICLYFLIIIYYYFSILCISSFRYS